MTAWNDFVKKIYHEGHNKDPNYMFKDALKDARKRKSEMGSSPASGVKSKKQGKKSKKSTTSKKNRTSRKNRK